MNLKAVCSAAFCLILTMLSSAPLVAEDSEPSAASAAADAVVFRRDVMPLLTRMGCNSVDCHGSFAGQGGLRLSLFAGGPADDYDALVKALRGRRVDRMQPAKSLMLLKATAEIDHGGGERFAKGSPQYDMLLKWIEQGAPYWDDRLPELVDLVMRPAEQVIEKGNNQAVKVVAVYDDGSEQDVTTEADFQSTDAEVAAVDETGQVTAKSFGKGSVVARYLRKSAVATIVVPQPLEDGFPEIAAKNKIDELVFANLKQLGLPPAEPCSDEEFLRRVYLDVTGALPTAEQARTFLTDADPQKRSKLIDELLESDAYVAFWTMKWADILRIKAEDPVSLWPKGAEAYYQWVYASIEQNKPYDQFARELLTATGSDFRNGASNYFRAVRQREPMSYAEATGLALLGVRLSCARCHGHPDEDWNEEHVLGLAAFFREVDFKFTSEWKEQILFRNTANQLPHPRTGEPVVPTTLDGQAIEVPRGEDPRAALADWMASPENPWFAKNIVNRIWYWLFGRGIIQQPDDLRSSNPPENPELLAYLEEELIGSGYDLKHIYRLMLNSQTYQLSSQPHPKSEGDTLHFSHYIARPLTAEQLIDSLAQVIGVPRGEFGEFRRPTLAPVTSLPDDVSAKRVSDGSAECSTAAMLGRPARATGFESERAGGVSKEMIAYLADSNEVKRAVSRSPWMREMMKDSSADEAIIETIFLAALSRMPTEEEKAKLSEYVAGSGNRSGALANVLWAVLNTNEFMLNH